MKRFILIDAHAIIHRTFHALPPLSTPVGEPSGAVYGFTAILLRILRELSPDYIAAAFDMPGPTFRHVAYERYKAHRPETPSELAGQFEKVRAVLDAFGVPVLQKEGFEADDIIGTVARRLKKNKSIETVIVTGDADALQLVGPRVKVYSMRRGISDTVIYDEKAVKERFGFGPASLVDYKGLRGDPSDNIPGVKGVGEKTAGALITTFGSIAGVYAALKKKDKRIAPALASRLAESKNEAAISRELATIKTDVPVSFSVEDAARRRDRDAEIRAVFQKFGFFSLLRQLGAGASGGSQKRPKAASAAALPLGASPGEAGVSAPAVVDDVHEFLRRAARASRLGFVAADGAIIVVPEGGAPFILSEKFFSGGATAAVPKGFFRNVALVVYDAKAILKLLGPGIIAPERAPFDVLLAAYIANAAERDFSFPAIASRAAGVLFERAAEAAPRLFDVAASLEQKLREGRLASVFRDIELPVAGALAAMEQRGILLDRAFLAKFKREIDGKIGRLEQAIYRRAGGEFNINSPQQLSSILFDKLGLATSGLRKTEKGGAISTGAAELEKLSGAHPIIADILEYRELAKLKTTYVDVLPGLADSAGRVHTTFNQAATATGRLSSSNPNLQNIPIQSSYGKAIRRAFVASPGFALVSFDYSQIELRVAAHLADDKKMIAAFKRGLDIHAMTASEIYNVPLAKVTPELRRAAKTLNFGVLYGMGAGAFAEATGMASKDARKYIDEYFRDFSGIRAYIDRTIAFAQAHGYVETLFGRRRPIPEIVSSAWRVKRDAERMAINMPIQGTATGDIIKMAMRDVERWIEREELGGRVRMLLQVHDELVFEIKKADVARFVPVIRKIMEGVAALAVPLVVDAKAGPNWGEQKPL